jgi:peptidoglycan-N-acetylglucosamine deacetylase
MKKFKIKKMKKLIIVFIAVGVLFFAMLAFYKISNSRSFQFFGGITNRVETDKKVIALTFDDGPTGNTDEILHILEENHVKATFFVTGREVEENLFEAQKIVAKGHQLANHSYSHTRMVCKSISFIKKEMEDTDDLIRMAGYEAEILFRPPGCKKLFLLPYYLMQQKRKTITWDIESDSIKEIKDDPEKITFDVFENAKPGSIILLHVMYESRRPSLQALPGIIKGLKEKGYRFVTLEELLLEEEK